MNAGTILIEYRFPAHWPPKTPLVLVDNEDRGTRARLILSAAGRLELELHSGGGGRRPQVPDHSANQPRIRSDSNRLGRWTARSIHERKGGALHAGNR